MEMEWDKAKIGALSKSEVLQLQRNATTRGRLDIAALCEEVLSAKPTISGAKTPRQKRDGPKLVSRAKAFEMRGVKLRNARWSWGGIRESDGTVVLTVWAEAIERNGDLWRYLLWAPNHEGDRPWSDSHGGKERLSHCMAALQRGEAEGVLIYGHRRGRELTLDQASKVDGADPYTVLRFRVERQGEEYWGVWENSKNLRQSPSE